MVLNSVVMILNFACVRPHSPCPELDVAHYVSIRLLVGRHRVLSMGQQVVVGLHVDANAAPEEKHEVSTHAHKKIRSLKGCALRIVAGAALVEKEKKSQPVLCTTVPADSFGWT